jgi:hypothetical protein
MLLLKFALSYLPAFVFSCPAKHNVSLDSHTLTLQDTNTQIFHQLNVKLQDILKAVKALASARRKS